MNHHSFGDGAGRTVLVANPSSDVYGSDLQMVESVRALTTDGGKVVVVIPADGPLVPRLRAAGAQIDYQRFPALQRASTSPLGFLKMILAVVAAVPRLYAYIRRLHPDALYVNTVTLPWWLLLGRLMRVPTVCHLHEAETQDRMVIRKLLILPLHLADTIIVISRSALDAMCTVSPRLRRRARLIYNGVPFPPEPPTPAISSDQHRLAVVGRLSPRKAPHLALEVTAELASRGLDVQLEVVGSAFSGYEWYEDQLRSRAGEPDLAGRVHFSGYCSPIWPALARNEIVLAPSLREPFGNAVVEAQLSLRPVVATAALGHTESIADGQTGILVPAGDVQAMADAAARLIEDPEYAVSLAEAGARSAREHFSTDRYGAQIVELMSSMGR